MNIGPLASSEPEPRMHVLFLCHVLPYPPDDGVHIRAYHLLRLLSEAFDITALCFVRSGSRGDAESVRAAVAHLQRYADVRVFPVVQSRSRVRFVRDHLRSLATARPYTWYAYESKECGETLKRLVRERSFDLAHVDSVDLCAYLPLLDGIPVCCGHHNVESALLRRRVVREESTVLRLYMSIQANLLERTERKWLGRVAQNVVVSEEDRRLLTDIAPDAQALVVPNGVDTAAIRPPRADGDVVLFMGGHGWAPNREAMRYFCEDILPRVRSRRPQARVVWLGRVPDRVRRDYQERFGVDVPGYVDDITPWLARAVCHIVPLRTGGGTRLKILDAWAAGQAVVSTSIGCEGLAARDGLNILVRDDPVGFADAVCRVLEDCDLRIRLGAEARRTAVERYDWKSIGELLIADYRRIMSINAGVQGHRLGVAV